VRSAAVGLLIVASLGACTSANRVPARASTVPEASQATEALMPLLVALHYPLSGSQPPTFAGDCKVGLVVVPTRVINAGARRGSETPCIYFTMFVTVRALTELPVAQLRGIMAHELGHVHLGHFRRREERAEAGGPASWWPIGRAYDREEELAADDFAVRLLRGLEPRYPGACRALVAVLEAMAQQRGRAAEWLASHPDPERRAERAKAACGSVGGVNSLATDHLRRSSADPVEWP
jgi:hypothetical protein